MRSEAISLLEKFTQAHGAPGAEAPVREVLEQALEGCGEFERDRLGGLASRLKNSSKDEDAPRVLVLAHLDEVGFMVQNITSDGFLQFLPLGGWWSHSLLAQRVRIRTRSGEEHTGVVASQPPHFLGEDAKNKVVPIDKLFIDVGAESDDDVTERLGIQLGDSIVPDSEFTALSHPDRYVSKAFDNRVGCALAAQAGKTLSSASSQLSCIAYFGASVQEEVGTRGATVLSRILKPDVAIILEGPPADDTPGLPEAERQGALNGGVQIRLYDPSALMSLPLADFITQVAKDEKIPFQQTVRRSGGTDARTTTLANAGVPCVVLGVPARYIHSHSSILDMRDYEAALSLVSAAVARMDAKTVSGFLPT
ncbi:M42 family metallopeptidase [Verrucomicrobiales bacterium]|nr:M42 family metallopeptidase [Verrucomicrobiales bacterium]